MGKDAEELLEKTREQGHEQDIRDDLLRNKASKLLAEKAVPVMKTSAEEKAGEAAQKQPRRKRRRGREAASEAETAPEAETE